MVLFVTHDAGELVGVFSSLNTAKRALQNIYDVVLDWYQYGPKLWSASETDIYIQEVRLDEMS